MYFRTGRGREVTDVLRDLDGKLGDFSDDADRADQADPYDRSGAEIVLLTEKPANFVRLFFKQFGNVWLVFGDTGTTRLLGNTHHSTRFLVQPHLEPRSQSPAGRRLVCDGRMTTGAACCRRAGGTAGT